MMFTLTTKQKPRSFCSQLLKGKKKCKPVLKVSWCLRRLLTWANCREGGIANLCEMPVPFLSSQGILKGTYGVGDDLRDHLIPGGATPVRLGGAARVTAHVRAPRAPCARCAPPRPAPRSPRSPRSAPLWPHLRTRARPRAAGGGRAPGSVAGSSPGPSRPFGCRRELQPPQREASGLRVSRGGARTAHTASSGCGSHAWGAEIPRVVGPGWVFPQQSEHPAWVEGGGVGPLPPTRRPKVRSHAGEETEL